MLLCKSQEGAIANAAGAQSQSQSVSVIMTFDNNSSGFNAGIINERVSGLNFGGKQKYS